MLEARLLALAAVFAPLSLLAFGGGASIFAEMQRQAVSVHGWMTDAQFGALFALSRAAPGPGTLVAALVGWHVAGVFGALAAALALYVPSSALLYAVGLWWRRARHSPVRRIVERGLEPVAVGLIFAGSWRVMQGAQAGWAEYAVALGALLLSLRRVSPYAVLGLAGLIYTASLWWPAG